mmetsp:Transcript_36272/g.43806  ORF Transcript_36272/g.43806 Transcript_36272/m.43806 type:complete len:334 (+) Transcript_36272:68-1069(+)|eukprot:CAMPEP_0197859582 /NCGR_PEP_ID=MMETSP1438-20131217/34239_1 /TAXON_ID=1461541 /ORGANISM="Pterosperma sp., Strain CCMP1384" /LENGTH=333 /DNA_ID=CAMNT_0043476117 /DNA_START=66 /DNA_END=1067 /DNA_ORIENTATION=+
MATTISQASQILRAPCANRTSGRTSCAFTQSAQAPVASVQSASFLGSRQSASFSFSSKQVRVQSAASRRLVVQATTETESETYELQLEKPIGIKFTRGGDGGAYVASKSESPDYDDVEIGDKIIKISASFGPEVWEAENYGQVMYAMKTRSGGIYMQLEKNYGDLSKMERTKSNAFLRERAGGNYGSGTAQLQQENYQKVTSLTQQRTDMFYDGLSLFKAGKYDEALVVFENVVGLEPANYIGDNMSKVTDVYRIAQYNVACCYSMIDQVQAGLDALNICMRSGFEDYKKIRSDPSLANLRESEDFKPLMDKYDEPFINENALKAIKGFFGRK